MFLFFFLLLYIYTQKKLFRQKRRAFRLALCVAVVFWTYLLNSEYFLLDLVGFVWPICHTFRNLLFNDRFNSVLTQSLIITLTFVRNLSHTNTYITMVSRLTLTNVISKTITLTITHNLTLNFNTNDYPITESRHTIKCTAEQVKEHT